MNSRDTYERGSLALCEATSPFVIDKLSISPFHNSENSIYLATSSYRTNDSQLIDIYHFMPSDGLFSTVARFPTPYPLNSLIWANHSDLAANFTFMTLSDSLRIYSNNKALKTFQHPSNFHDSRILQGPFNIVCPILGGDWSSNNPQNLISSSLDGKVNAWELTLTNHFKGEVVSAVSSSFLSPPISPQNGNEFRTSLSPQSTSSQHPPNLLNKGSMPICDVKFGPSDNIIAFALGSGDIYLSDIRESSSNIVVNSPPRLELSNISWLPQSQYILQSDTYNSELYLHDIRRLNISKASTHKIQLETPDQHSLVSSYINPLNTSTLLSAYEEGLVEIRDIPQFLGRPPSSNSKITIKGTYNVNQLSYQAHPRIEGEAQYSKYNISAFDISKFAYKGKTNTNSVQIAALALFPQNLNISYSSPKKPFNKANFLPSFPAYKLSSIEEPKLQIFRIN